LIKKNRNANTSARRRVVPAWLEEKGSTLEEPRIEAGGNQEKASMVSKGQA
jgi:hypothetical protein